MCVQHSQELLGGICRSLLSLLLEVWIVGLGMRSILSHSLGSLGWLSCLSWLRLMVFGLRGCWMPFLLWSRRLMVILLL